MAESNKTEQPTPKRRSKARDKGQIARSRDLSNVMAMIGVAAVLAWELQSAGARWSALYRASLDVAVQGQLENGNPLLIWSGIEVFHWMVPLLATALTLSLVTSLAQGGFVFAPQSLAPDISRLSPANKLKQIFSLTGLSALLKSLLPFSAICYVGFATLRSHWQAFLKSSYFDLRSFAHFVFQVLAEVSWKSGLILLAWGAIDYFLTWRKLESDLRMSREELREEYKETDGNPAIKARIRKLQRTVRRQQLKRATETATVVVTNPTHFAVALKYEVEMEAPVVVAKGRDLLAQTIREAARWSDVPIIENPPLAQALYWTVEVGQGIPAKLYSAVAEILVMVYRAQEQVRQQRARTSTSARESRS